MTKKANWHPDEDKILREEVKKNTPLKEIAKRLNKTEEAVYLYCYRHFIPLRKQVKNPMMRNLLQIKFGNVELFRPNKAFFEKVGINQKRWAFLIFGYVQPTQDELLRVARELNFSVDETFKLLDSRQLDLFDEQ